MRIPTITKSVVSAILLLTLASPAGAAVLYGQRNGGGYPVWRIDTVAQTVTPVGTPSDYGPDVQLTPDQSTLLIAARNSEVLLHMDTATGVQTATVNMTYPPHPNPPTPGAVLNIATAMEFVGDTLYAAFTYGNTASAPGYLGTIDPATGATTLIGELTGMVGPAGGLSFADGVMYAVSAGRPDSQLYTIDLATGAATFVADITYGGTQISNVTALAIVSGVAYSTVMSNNGGVIDTNALYRLDLATGVLTQLFDMGDEVFSLTATPNPYRAGIPTLSQWGIILFALLLLTSAVLVLRRYRETRVAFRS